MIKNIYILLATISLVTISCQQEGNLKLQENTTTREASVNSDLYTNTTTNTNQNNIGSFASFTPNNNQQLNPEHGQPGHRCDIEVGAPLYPNSTNTPTESQATNNTVQLNPEHGQPGHKCEIPVGAPLNSVPESNQPTQSSPIIQQVETPPATNTKTPDGINPEHGQPGHRCDIPVGAPLSSQPMDKPNQSNTEILPMQTAPSQSSTTSDSKLNPEHGQPGHRCDIPVGAPLSSQPVNADKEDQSIQLDFSGNEDAPTFNLNPSKTDSDK